jgi:hypothetical protein
MAQRKRRVISAWSKEDVKNLRAFAKAKLSGTVAQKAMKLGVHFRSIRRKAV